MKLQYAAISLRGTMHEENEDRALMGMRALPPESEAVVCGQDSASRAFAVFDGVGGHAGGAQAAEDALDAFSEACARERLQPASADGEGASKEAFVTFPEAGESQTRKPASAEEGDADACSPAPIAASPDADDPAPAATDPDAGGSTPAAMNLDAGGLSPIAAALNADGQASTATAPNVGGFSPAATAPEEGEQGDSRSCEWRERLACALRCGNEAVRTMRERGHRPGFAAAAGVAFDGDGCVHVFHAGDVRVYRYRAPYAMRLTKDHSLAERWRDENPGMTPPDDIRHTITRSLGHPAPPSRSSDPFWPFDAARPAHALPGDTYLVCSDGIWEYAGEEDVECALENASSPADLADALGRLALLARERGSYDDATAVAVRVC